MNELRPGRDQVPKNGDWRSSSSAVPNKRSPNSKPSPNCDATRNFHPLDREPSPLHSIPRLSPNSGWKPQWRSSREQTVHTSRKSPVKNDRKSPIQNGHKSLVQNGSKSPAQNGRQRPSVEKSQKSPIQNGHKTPHQNGHVLTDQTPEYLALNGSDDDIRSVPVTPNGELSEKENIGEEDSDVQYQIKAVHLN